MDPILHTIATVIVIFLSWKAGFWYGSYIQRHYAVAELFMMLRVSMDAHEAMEQQDDDDKE